MNRPSRSSLAATGAVLCALAIAACGGSSSKPSSGSQGSGPAASPAALSAEAQSAATGDIPDNQVFLTFRDAKAGYSIKYPEGWAQQGVGSDVTFRDKNNLVHVVVGRGGPPTVAGVQAELAQSKGANPTVKSPPKPIHLPSGPAIKTTYATQNAPNPVTGKRVTLIVDRYELARGGKRAVVDLGTPKGVDNVDAYRMMIESFTWR